MLQRTSHIEFTLESLTNKINMEKPKKKKKKKKNHRKKSMLEDCSNCKRAFINYENAFVVRAI